MTTKIVVASTATMVALSACATAPPSAPYVPWKAAARHSMASGDISCVVSRSRRDSPLMVFLHETPTGARIRWLTAITADGLYPGSRVSLSIDGQRFSGVEDIPLTEDLLAALKNGKRAFIEWSPWPSGGYRENVTFLTGFAAAYDECEADMDRLRGLGP